MNDERLVREHLVADVGVADLVGSRVYTEFPDEPTFPLVVLSKFAGEDAAWGHISIPRIQIESWADYGDRPTAVALDMAVREAMKSYTIAGDHAQGVANGAELVLSRYFPDTVDGATRRRPRYILDYRLWLHPLPA